MKAKIAAPWYMLSKRHAIRFAFGSPRLLAEVYSFLDSSGTATTCVYIYTDAATWKINRELTMTTQEGMEYADAEARNCGYDLL